MPSFRKTKKRKALARSKIYLFDVGVANALKGQTQFEENSAAFGDAFEHFIICEVRALLSYSEDSRPLCYWRSVNHQEVGLLIGTDFAIEIKSTQSVHSKHLKGLRALQEEGLFQKYLVVSRDPYCREIEKGIFNVHWQEFLTQLTKPGFSK